MKIFAYLERRPERTRHLFGIERAELEGLLEFINHEHQPWNQPEPERKHLRRPGGGAKPKLSREEEVGLFLFVLRQGVTFEIAGLLFDLSSSQAHAIFHLWLLRLRECLPSSLAEELAELGESIDVVEEEQELLVDSWEQPRERPSGNDEQKQYYSGKKRTHTFKSQIFTSEKGDEIIDVIPSVRGPRSDISLFREQKYKGDKAYVGDEQIVTPMKKPKGGELSEEQKQRNREISSKRIYVEHVIRRVKLYRIAAIRYRWSPQKHGDIIAVLCALVRIRLGKLNLREFARRLWPQGKEISDLDRGGSKMAFT